MDYYSAIQDSYQLLTFLAITPVATTILLFTIIILFLISFLVAGSEVAFFSLTIKDINMLKTRQQPSYKRIVSLLENPKTLLASMLIANSLVNIGIILISNTLMNNWIDNLHMHVLLEFIIKVIIVTSLLVMFGEVLPKVWATHHKIWFASTSSLVIEIFNSLFYQVSNRLVKLSDRIESRFDTGSSRMDDIQLDYAIDLLPDHEATTEEKQILKGIRKFGNTTVKQTMRTRLDVSGIEISDSFRDVKGKVEEMHYSRLPVYKNNLDEIVGILHTKDLLPHLDEEVLDWHPLMRPVFYVHEQKLIEDLLQDFRNKRIHLAVVVDEFGGTSGIVTLEDIMEEIIGDIQDEFDDEQSVNKKLDDFNYIFEGKTMINDVCKTLRIPVNTFDKIRGDSDSLAGLVLEIAGEFPEVNEAVVAGDFTFIPLEINKNRIEKVKLSLKKKLTSKMHNVKNIIRIPLLFLFVFVFYARCNSTYTSKKKGYYKVDFPKRQYIQFDRQGFPYSFEYPAYANIERDSSYLDNNPENPYWVNIDFPSFNGKIFISYKVIGGTSIYKVKNSEGKYRDSIGKNTFQNMVNDSYNLTYKNDVKANSIEDSIMHTPNHITGIFFRLSGSVATAKQFFLSDSIHNFLRGALYFDATPNEDSLQPVNQFLEEDMKHIINTLKWK